MSSILHDTFKDGLESRTGPTILHSLHRAGHVMCFMLQLRKKKRYIYLKCRVTGKSSICFFTSHPQMAAMSRDGLDQYQEPGGYSKFPHGHRDPNSWAILHCFASLLSGSCITGGIAIWDSSITGNGFYLLPHKARPSDVFLSVKWRGK